MIVSRVAQPVRNRGAVGVDGQVKPLLNIAALCRLALLRNELLLNIAAAPRPAGDPRAAAPPVREPRRTGRPDDRGPDLRRDAGDADARALRAPRELARRRRAAGGDRLELIRS